MSWPLHPIIKLKITGKAAVYNQWVREQDVENRARTLTSHKGLVQKRAVIFSVKHHVGRWVRSLCSEPWNRQVSGDHRRGTAEDAPRGVGDPKSEPDSKVRCVDGTLHGRLIVAAVGR